MSLSAHDREHKFQSQLRMQSNDADSRQLQSGCSIEVFETEIISRFCNVSLFQANIQGLEKANLDIGRQIG